MPYMTVHVPTAGLPLTCSIPGCKWWGRMTNDYTKHTRSDGHKAKSTLSPAVTGMAVANPKAVQIPKDAFLITPEEPLAIERPKELVCPTKVQSRNTDIQLAVKRLKTSHNSDNSSDPKSTANNTSNATEQYDPNPSPHPGPSYQPTPFSIWLKRSSSHTPSLPLPTPPPPPPHPRPLNTSAPLLDERPNLLQKILISLQAAPKGQSQVRRLERFSCLRLQRKLLVSNHGIHHGTCVTHVPRCMLGSLTSFYESCCSPWGHVLPSTDTTQWAREVFCRVSRVPARSQRN